MSDYVLWLKQSGQGCDYMIGCGQVVVPLEGFTGEPGTQAVVNKLEHYGFPHHDRMMDQIVILKVVREFDPDEMADFVRELEEAREDDDEDEETTARRELYEQLKKEFG